VFINDKGIERELISDPQQSMHQQYVSQYREECKDATSDLSMHHYIRRLGS
jgi:hypothetical protein